MDGVRVSFDDRVGVEEMTGLMAAMEADTSGRFPPRDIFHYALRTPEKEAVALEHGINVTARDAGGGLVGYLRVVSDRAYIHYIVDVMVRPDRRGEGIGSALVEATLAALRGQGYIKVLLTAIPGKESFYTRFGFRATLSPVLALRGEDLAGAG